MRGSGQCGVRRPRPGAQCGEKRRERLMPMTHDVFISYSSRDKPIADGICATMEQITTNGTAVEGGST